MQLRLHALGQFRTLTEGHGRRMPKKKAWEPELKRRLLELRRRHPGWGNAPGRLWRVREHGRAHARRLAAARARYVPPPEHPWKRASYEAVMARKAAGRGTSPEPDRDACR